MLQELIAACQHQGRIETATTMTTTGSKDACPLVASSADQKQRKEIFKRVNASARWTWDQKTLVEMAWLVEAFDSKNTCKSKRAIDNLFLDCCLIRKWKCNSLTTCTSVQIEVFWLISTPLFCASQISIQWHWRLIWHFVYSRHGQHRICGISFLRQTKSINQFEKDLFDSGLRTSATMKVNWLSFARHWALMRTQAQGCPAKQEALVVRKSAPCWAFCLKAQVFLSFGGSNFWIPTKDRRTLQKRKTFSSDKLFYFWFHKPITSSWKRTSFSLGSNSTNSMGWHFDTLSLFEHL